jgi:hypothetical protein
MVMKFNLNILSMKKNRQLSRKFKIKMTNNSSLMRIPNKYFHKNSQLRINQSLN